MKIYLQRLLGTVVHPSKTFTQIAKDENIKESVKFSLFVTAGYFVCAFLFGLWDSVSRGKLQDEFLPLLLSTSVLLLLAYVPLYVLHKLAYFESNRGSFDKLFVVFTYICIIIYILGLPLNIDAIVERIPGGSVFAALLLLFWGFIMILYAVSKLYGLTFRKSLRLYIRMFFFLLVFGGGVFAIISTIMP